MAAASEHFMNVMSSNDFDNSEAIITVNTVLMLIFQGADGKLNADLATQLFAYQQTMLASMINATAVSDGPDPSLN